MSQEQGRQFLQTLPQVQKELPISPAVLAELFQQTQTDSRSSLHKISETLGQDQALATKVLTRANSAYYGFESRISSLSRATTLLGLSELRKIILGINLSALARMLPQKTRFDLQDYWRHHSFTAIMARELASFLKLNDPEDLFTMGLLHDVGKLITAIYVPGSWTEIQNMAEKKGISDFQAETEFWGIDHALIGAMTLRLWYFPQELTETINWHHTPELAGEKHQKKARILAIANHTARQMQQSLGPGTDTSSHRELELSPEFTQKKAHEIWTGSALQELENMLSQ